MKTLELDHEDHPGKAAMKRHIRTKVWWPKIDSNVETIVSSCRSCLLVPSAAYPQPMKRQYPILAWIYVAMDLCDKPGTCEHLFVIVDYYSKFVEVVILKRTTASDTIRDFLKICHRFGFPVSVTTDNGPYFNSRKFQDLG